MIMGEDVNCCGTMVRTDVCQGPTGKCDPINTWYECKPGCAVGEAGCGIGNAPTQSSAIPKPAVAAIWKSAQLHGRFLESACGRGFNVWLEGKLTLKYSERARSIAGK